MSMSARVVVLRARWAARAAARDRRRRLERELADYSSPRDRRDLEATLDRYPDGVTWEFRAILARQELERRWSRRLW